MEINVNFVLLEDLEEKPNGAVETHIVIVRQSNNPSSALEERAAGFGAHE
jgi:hypothetical protein